MTYNFIIFVESFTFHPSVNIKNNFLVPYYDFCLPSLKSIKDLCRRHESNFKIDKLEQELLSISSSNIKKYQESAEENGPFHLLGLLNGKKSLRWHLQHEIEYLKTY